MNVHPDVHFEELARSTDDFNRADASGMAESLKYDFLLVP